MVIDLLRRDGRRQVAAYRMALSAIAALQLGMVSSHAQIAPPVHATVQVVAENTELRPGERAWIGVLFDLEPGWHVYWVNPGDAGDPPRIQWETPAGFSVGDVRWPVPSRLRTASLVDYGYEGHVLLAAPLQVPASYATGTSITLTANVRYVICREVCISAKASSSATIPNGNRTPAAATAARELFRTTRQHWPAPAPREWQVGAVDAGDHFTLSVRTGSREASALFFPLELDHIDNAAPQAVTPSARGVELALTKLDPLAKPISMLRGLLVLGPGRAFEIAAPVSQPR